jgi:lipoate-protein ligase A
MPPLYWIFLGNTPIFRQLQIEEALLRKEEASFCLVNYGAPLAIVMGISNQMSEVLNISTLLQKPIPLIRRCSGGGTVVINPDTLLISFIIDKRDLNIPLFPEKVHLWCTHLYKQAWQIPTFSYREHDYVIGNQKCGGNAQYFQKTRWLHHTSFLWDFDPDQMNYLALPSKRPSYRQDRPHETFLCRLKEHAVSIEHLLELLKRQLAEQFELRSFNLDTWVPKEHRQATEMLYTQMNSKVGF